jgi:transposase
MVVACDEDHVAAVALAEGQCHNAPLAEPVLAEAAAALGGFDQVLGDKGFDSDAIRMACLDVHDALTVIPNRDTRTDPWPWDDVMAQVDRQRNRVERVIGKAKRFRTFATRYENLSEMYLAVVPLVFGFIHV